MPFACGEIVVTQKRPGVYWIDRLLPDRTHHLVARHSGYWDWSEGPGTSFDTEVAAEDFIRKNEVE